MALLLRAVGAGEGKPKADGPALAFTFRRRREGCEVGLKDTATRSWSNLTLGRLPPNIAAARELARAYAAEHGVTYAEAQLRDPEPTPEETRKMRAGSSALWANHNDTEAQAAEVRDEYRQAAERWITAARALEEYAAYHPGDEDRWGRAAANRVDLAMRALGRYRARLLAIRRGSAMRDLEGTRPEGGP